ncbi:sugar phosphate isomerase/epimerase family protein [Tuberibacillus sp. Marseille-P3662]|uniref:sugar phosphate isomerase/epimerase family protein n=1 Tax=Tuberibacillus sp. Marseille-P3662 TaxID=1965358 RepID=UPI000A1CB2C0|nr:sugar phosphate isomerase/epimerase [Tuberibacillus sp. Marseille-P3662]
MMQKPVALQMYTLREESSKDFIGTLEKVASLGYKSVEFAGYGGLSAAALRTELDRLDLVPIASHIPLEQLEHHLDEVMAYQKELGNQGVVCPVIPLERRNKEGYQQLADLFNRVGFKCQKEGLTFYYHHHDFELTRFEDQTGLDLILNGTNPDWVGIELDVYWLKYAGQNPQDWMTRCRNRNILIHLKDMTTDGERFFAELGTGGIELESIIDYGERLNVNGWIVEQDQCKGSPIKSIETSLNYLRRAFNLSI